MIQRVLSVLLFLFSFLIFASDTVLKLYRPFGEVIDQTPLIVKHTLQGQCNTQSRLLLREDAWYCQAEGKVFDPCFVKLAGNHMEAICPQSPWVGDSVQINVTHPLNNNNHIPLDMSRVFPWGIELVNGERCQAVEPDEIYDSMPVRYRCSNQNVLIGYIQRCKSVWSMLEKNADGVVTVDLKKAWF